AAPPLGAIGSPGQGGTSPTGAPPRPATAPGAPPVPSSAFGPTHRPSAARSTVSDPPPWSPQGVAPVGTAGQHSPTEGEAVRPSLWSADPQSTGDPDVLASEVQQRVIARLEDWIATDLDDR